MSKETGGNAFPIPGADFQTFKPSTEEEWRRIQSGMTLRDYFAAKAMQGWLTSYGEDMAHPAQRGNAEDVARNAYALADAMLKVRGEAHHEE